MIDEVQVKQQQQQRKNRGDMKATPGVALRRTFHTLGEILSAFTTLNRFRIASVLVWFVGAYTTSIVIERASLSFPQTSLSNTLSMLFYANVFVVAVLTEFFLTTVTAPIVAGGKPHPVSVFFLLVNIGINSIVTYPIAEGLVSSGAWINMENAVGVYSYTLASLFGFTWSLSLGSGDVVVYTLMLILAFALAVGSEILWKLGE